MTTTAATHGRYRFSQVARMEWTKLRSLRSTWWVLAVTVAGAIGIAVAVGVNTEDAAADLTNNALAGISLGLLLVGVLGVLMMTGEYSSGMIRATLAAIPNRPLVLAAKAAVFGLVALAAGEAAGFIAFFAGGAARRRRSASRGCCGRWCWAGRASAWSGSSASASAPSSGTRRPPSPCSSAACTSRPSSWPCSPTRSCPTCRSRSSRTR